MKKILIIEDDLDIQELIQFFLEDQGYEVITASDGIDGIAVFLKEQIDLILLDILLPKMEKNDLFKTVILDGALPRKTFSMGHSYDKRYYLEARKIR